MNLAGQARKFHTRPMGVATQRCEVVIDKNLRVLFKQLCHVLFDSWPGPQHYVALMMLLVQEGAMQ